MARKPQPKEDEEFSSNTDVAPLDKSDVSARQVFCHFILTRVVSELGKTHPRREGGMSLRLQKLKKKKF